MHALILALAAINLATFAAFAWDKRAAVAARRRIPERTLLRLALLGGSPGAVAAQRLLRHKTRKQPFADRLRAIVLLHMAILLGAAALRLSGRGEFAGADLLPL